MSSNPLMMGYEGGDQLLATALAGGRATARNLCAGYGRWPGRPSGSVSVTTAH